VFTNRNFYVRSTGQLGGNRTNGNTPCGILTWVASSTAQEYIDALTCDKRQTYLTGLGYAVEGVSGLTLSRVKDYYNDITSQQIYADTYVSNASRRTKSEEKRRSCSSTRNLPHGDGSGTDPQILFDLKDNENVAIFLTQKLMRDAEITEGRVYAGIVAVERVLVR